MSDKYVMIKWCETCTHSKVCFGESLYRQFKEEVDAAGNKYIEETKDILKTSYEEWFKIDVSCKHYSAQFTLR